MIDPDDAPVPELASRYILAPELAAPMVIGTLATGGVREYHAVLGGSFAGAGIDGELVGGGETLLCRPDGVGVLDASFLVRDRDGRLIRILGNGYRTEKGAFAGTRMSVVFEVDEQGPYAHLSIRAYVAERPAGSDRYAIAEIL